MEYLVKSFDVDKLIVMIFLLITFIIGMISGRGVKDTKDYAIANKSFGTPILLLTLLATMIGGTSTTGEAAQFYNDGLIYLIASIGTPISILITAWFISPKFDKRFDGMISIADIIRYYYGETAAKFAGFVAFLICLVVLSVQFIAMGYLISNFLGINYKTSVYLTAGLVILYSSFGGIRSVVITDVLQFGVLIVLIPLIASIAVTEAGGLKEIFSNFSNPHYIEITTHPKFTEYSALLLFWSIPFCAFLPTQNQRYLMAKNHKQATKITYLYFYLKIAIIFLIMSIAFSALKLFPGVQPNAIIPTIINNLLPNGIKGLAVAGMLSVTMSTADSYLNCAGILFAHNILPKQSIKTESGKLKFMKILTLTSGIITMLFALRDNNIISIYVLSEILTYSALGIPLLLAFLNLKVSSNSYWATNACSCLSFIILNYYKVAEFVIPILICLTGFISFFIVHLLENKGIVFVKNKNVSETTPKIKLLNHLVKNLLKNIYTRNLKIKSKAFFLKERMDSYGVNYLMFGIFCCINYILPYFMWTYQKPKNYPLMLAMRLIAGILCTGLLLKDYWPKKMKKFFPAYWYFMLLYCLPFVTTVMFILMEAHIEWLINLTLSIMLLTILVDWLSFVVIFILGTALGYLFYRYAFGIPDIQLDFATTYLLIYICVFATIIGLLFARKKELLTKEKISLIQLFGRSIAHEVQTPLSNINSKIHYIESVVEKLKLELATQSSQSTCYYNELKNLAKSLRTTSNQGLQTIDSLLTSLKTSVVAEDKGMYSLNDCVTQAIIEYNQSSLNPDSIEIKINKDIKFHGSLQYMKHVIFNLLNDANKNYEAELKIEIWTSDNVLHFKFKGQGKPQDDLPYIFDRFYTNTRNGICIGLAFCKMVMEEIGGTIECDSEQDDYTEFMLRFPNKTY